MKDDLLAQIEDLSRYNEKTKLVQSIVFSSSTEQVLRDQVSSLETVKSRLQSRYVEVFLCLVDRICFILSSSISEVEEELRKTREELDKKKREEEVRQLRFSFFFVIGCTPLSCFTLTDVRDFDFRKLTSSSTAAAAAH